MAQQRWVQSDPYSDLISTTDCGEVNSVHPMSKEPLSLRLTDLVLFREYGIGDATVLTPVARSARRSGRTVTVDFHNSAPLKTTDGKAVTYLELAGKDGEFHPAEGTIQGDKLVVVSAKVPEPRKIRFGFDCIAIHNLVNSAGIPVAPFELKVF
jgi:sialate O-acetylesterase